MVSTIGVENDGEVHVYDSICQLAPTQTQIASIPCTEQSKIELHTMDMQMQGGGSDCGLVAIAFAMAIINGIPPGKFCIQSSKD